MQGAVGLLPGLQELLRHRYPYKALSTFSICSRAPERRDGSLRVQQRIHQSSGR